jgi:HlyD family secretion protein
MKTIRSILLGLIAAVVIGGVFLYLYQGSQPRPVVYQTEQAQIADITKTTVATGSIVPRREVEVKPKVTGVLGKLYVEPGQIIQVGDPLGKVSIIPDAMQINRTESALRSAQIALASARRELDRHEALFQRGVIADAELQKFRTDHALRKQEASVAASTLDLTRDGQARGQGTSSMLIVTSTAPGMVIDVPVKEGFSVIQANNFTPGTTIAVIADMDDMIFDGRVDEAEVAKLKPGMKLAIKVGALEEDELEGRLEYIAPRGKEIDGAIQFEIKAAVTNKAGLQIRAGYSANADIVLEERKQVLTIREALVQYDHATPFIEIETAPQTFVKHDIKLGLSDGLKVAVLDGMTRLDRVKIPAGVGPAPPLGSGSSPKPVANK